MNRLKGILDTLLSLAKVIGVCITVGTCMLSLYGRHLENIINVKNSKIVNRVISLEEFDRQHYIYMIHRAYSLLNSKHTVPTSDLEFIVRFRTKFIFEDKVIEKKLEYIYEEYIERTK